MILTLHLFLIIQYGCHFLKCSLYFVNYVHSYSHPKFKEGFTLKFYKEERRIPKFLTKETRNKQAPNVKYLIQRPQSWKGSRSRVRHFATPWTVAHQAPPSMGFSRPEYWSGLPFPSPGDLPNPGIEPRSPSFQAEALTSGSPGKPHPLGWARNSRSKRALLGLTIHIMKVTLRLFSFKAEMWNLLVHKLNWSEVEIFSGTSQWS